MFEVFMSDFIKQCIADGKNSPGEICEVANEKIDELDIEIKKIELLRTRQSNLRTVIRRLGGEIQTKCKPKHSSIKMDFSASEDKLNSSIRDLCIKICKFMENSKRATVRDIMDSVANIEESTSVFMSIKWLADKGILSRDETSSERVVILGDSWENRPTA